MIGRETVDDSAGVAEMVADEQHPGLVRRGRRRRRCRGADGAMAEQEVGHPAPPRPSDGSGRPPAIRTWPNGGPALVSTRWRLPNPRGTGWSVRCAEAEHQR